MQECADGRWPVQGVRGHVPRVPGALADRCRHRGATTANHCRRTSCRLRCRSRRTTWPSSTPKTATTTCRSLRRWLSCQWVLLRLRRVRRLPLMTRCWCGRSTRRRCLRVGSCRRRSATSRTTWSTNGTRTKPRAKRRAPATTASSSRSTTPTWICRSRWLRSMTT